MRLSRAEGNGDSVGTPTRNLVISSEQIAIGPKLIKMIGVATSMHVYNLHPIGYEKRAMNHQPDLFKALRDPLRERGHQLVTEIEIASVDNLDLEVWDLHDGDPRIPKGTYSPYDQQVFDYILKNKIPVAIHDNFDHRGTPEHHCTWPGANNFEDLKNVGHQHWAQFVYRIGTTPHPIVYFMRKMQKSVEYPPWVYPLEYPLFNEWPLVSKEELFARPNDVCFLAETGWIRAKAVEGLVSDGRLKLDVEHIDSSKRMPFEKWVDRHRQAKLFLECDNSMGSERPMRLMTVAPMLRVKSDHLLAFPREDLVHQVEVGDYDGRITKQDIDKILYVVTDPDLLYSIYVAGAEHMRAHYSMEARNNYIIDRLEKLAG